MNVRLLILALCLTTFTAAQTPPNAPETQATLADTTARVPGIDSVFHGLNAGVTFSGVHDSGIGWYTVLTPAMSYTFSSHLTADVSASLYPSRNAYITTTSSTAITSHLEPTHWDAGDTWLAAHYTVTPHNFISSTSAALTLPTGSSSDGLSTGRVTYDFSNHLEHYTGNLGAIVDLGIGDSSALFNNLVIQTYDSLGSIAHFQTGLSYWFPSRTFFQSVAYEHLPLGDQKIYTTIQVQNPPGSPNPTGTHPERIVTGRHIYEDNGFTTSFSTPLTEHITFSSSYNRSLRFHLDTVSAGLTFVWKGTPIHRHESVYDKAFEEGERLLDQQAAAQPATK